MTLYKMQGNHLFSFTLPNRYNTGVYLKSQGMEDSDSAVPERTTYMLKNTDDDMDLMGGGDDDTEDMAAAKMKNLFHGIAGEKLLMEYDFDDRWEIELTLESITKDTDLPANELPRVLAGKGFGIVEDCGGMDGFVDVARAFVEKSGDAYEEYREWLGVKNLNLERLDRKDMGVRLKKLPRIFLGAV